MKLVSESSGITSLATIRLEFAAEIRRSYEHNAKPCSACENPGICCRDEHFVNVRITRLEAKAIIQRLEQFDEAKRDEVYLRVNEAIDRYDLTSGDSLLKTYACPLFEKGVGCLVHETAKPLPCIAHACYENEADLPPGQFLEEEEMAVANLNRRVYGTSLLPIPIPVAIARNRQ